MPTRRRGPRETLGEYWISQRANSSAWCRTWFDKQTRQTRRVSLGTSDLGKAKLMLADWVTTHNRMSGEHPQDVTLARVLTRHYEHHGRYLRSAEAVRYSLLRWNDFFMGCLVSEVTPARQRQFVEEMRSSGLSDGYIRRILADGKSAISRALREGEISSAPFISLVAEGEARERIATIREIARLFEAADHDHFRIYLMLAIGTLARPGAILELTHSQVDTDARVINLNPTGRKQTKKRRPIVPICSALLTFLGSLDYGALLANCNDGPLVNWAGKPLKGIRTTFNRVKVRAAKNIRLDAAKLARNERAAGQRKAARHALKAGRKEAAAMLELTPYVLRHTMASVLRRRGVPVWEVAGFLGHSSGYKTTERYAKFGPDHLSEATRAIDSYFADLALTLGGAGFGRSFDQVRASCVLPGRAPGVKTPGKVVEPSGIEPLTSTMPL